MKRLSLLPLLLVLVLPIFAAGSKDVAPDKQAATELKKEIIIAPSLGFTSMDVQVTTSATDKSVYVMVFDTLCARDSATGEIVPALAESWRQVSDTLLEF
jgi:peptide/nickel transport system substrate-binding protein